MVIKSPTFPVPLKVGVVSLVLPLVTTPVTGATSSVMIGAAGCAGGVLSTVRVKLADGIPVLPATSVAVAVNLCGPSASEVGVNVQCRLAVR